MYYPFVLFLLLYRYRDAPAWIVFLADSRSWWQKLRCWNWRIKLRRIRSAKEGGEFIIRAELSLFIFPALRESGVYAKKMLFYSPIYYRKRGMKRRIFLHRPSDREKIGIFWILSACYGYKNAFFLYRPQQGNCIGSSSRDLVYPGQGYHDCESAICRNLIGG